MVHLSLTVLAYVKSIIVSSPSVSIVLSLGFVRNRGGFFSGIEEGDG